MLILNIFVSRLRLFKFSFPGLPMMMVAGDPSSQNLQYCNRAEFGPSLRCELSFQSCVLLCTIALRRKRRTILACFPCSRKSIDAVPRDLSVNHRVCAVLPPLCFMDTSTPLYGWGNQAIKFPMSTARPPTGCHFQVLCQRKLTDVPDPNAVEAWFAIAHPPLRATTFLPSPSADNVLVNGPGAGTPSRLHVYGRALAFYVDPDGALSCIPPPDVKQ